jgi:hypothetical protein
LSHVTHALDVYNKTQNLLLGKPDMSWLSDWEFKGKKYCLQEGPIAMI